MGHTAYVVRVDSRSPSLNCVTWRALVRGSAQSVMTPARHLTSHGSRIIRMKQSERLLLHLLMSTEGSMIVEFDYAPTVCQGLILFNASADNHTMVFTVNGVQYVFELDNNGSVFAGRTPVQIGANEAATALNFANAVNITIGDQVRATADGTAVDVAALAPGIDMQVSNVGGAWNIVNTMNSQRVLPTACVMADRIVLAEDVARGRIVVQHRLDFLSFVNVLMYAASNNLTIVGWSGTVFSLPGQLVLNNGGAIPFVAGNVFKFIMIGDRYEA
jgi:hypothetical protein